MGDATKGYYCFKHQDQYYIFLSKYDSYPQWLGRKIVAELVAMTDEDVTGMKTLLEKIKKSHNKTMRTEYFVGLFPTLQDPFSYAFWVMKDEPAADMFVRYVYIIDLDKDFFKIKSCCLLKQDDVVKYKLWNIPVDWEDLIEDS
jgi:hypothetical protein